MKGINVTTLKRLQDIRTEINKKLLRDSLKDIPERERTDHIYHEFCDTVKRIFPPGAEEKRWIRTQYENAIKTDEEDEKTQDKVETQKGDETKDETKAEQTGTSLVDQGRPIHHRVNMRLVALIAAALILVFLVFARSLIQNGIFPFAQNSIPTSSGFSTPVLSVTSDLTLTVLLTTTAEPDFAQQTIAARVHSIAATPSPTETPSQLTTTETVTPLPTNTIIPAPTEVFLFEEDFEGELSPEWEIVGETPGISDGRLAPLSATWLIVGEETWTDYIIDLDVYGASCNGGGVIVFRMQDPGTYIGMPFGCDGVLLKYENGVQTEQLSPYFRLLLGGSDLHITIQVTGDTIEVVGANTTTIPIFPQGKVGLLTTPGLTYDNFVVRPIP
jgi:hypothetical protein